MLNDRLLSIVEENDILNPLQAGFRKEEECVAQAGLLLEVLQRRHRRNMDTYVCFLDFEKAYDCVPHKKLFEKLSNYRISGYLLNAIKALYLNPTIKVKIGDHILKIETG